MDGKLTDIAVKKAKADGKRRKIFDGGGLCIQIEPTGRSSCCLALPSLSLQKTVPSSETLE
jgi:hypothetical protein